MNVFDGAAACFLRQSGRFLGRPIPDGAQQALLVEVARHAQAHCAQADESCAQGHWHSTSIEVFADARAASSSSEER